MINGSSPVCPDSTAALTVACIFCVLSAILSALTRSPYSRVSTAAAAAAARTKTKPVRRPCQQWRRQRRRNQQQRQLHQPLTTVSLLRSLYEHVGLLAHSNKSRDVSFLSPAVSSPSDLLAIPLCTPMKLCRPTAQTIVGNWLKIFEIDIASLTLLPIFPIFEFTFSAIHLSILNFQDKGKIRQTVKWQVRPKCLALNLICVSLLFPILQLHKYAAAQLSKRITLVERGRGFYQLSHTCYNFVTLATSARRKNGCEESSNGCRNIKNSKTRKPSCR